MDDFWGELREARDQAGLDQSELAERIGRKPSTISAWERGVRKSPLPRRVVEEIEEACGITDQRLLYAGGYLRPPPRASELAQDARLERLVRELFAEFERRFLKELRESHDEEG